MLKNWFICDSTANLIVIFVTTIWQYLDITGNFNHNKVYWYNSCILEYVKLWLFMYMCVCIHTYIWMGEVVNWVTTHPQIYADIVCIVQLLHIGVCETIIVFVHTYNYMYFVYKHHVYNETVMYIHNYKHNYVYT